MLVGGRSSRMGRDKALLPWRGCPLAQWAAIAGRAKRRNRDPGWALLNATPIWDFRVIPDLFPGEGPLGGILTALRHSTAEWNLIVACDMPAIDAALLAHLLDAARQSGDGRAAAGHGRRTPAAALRRLPPHLPGAFRDGVFAREPAR